MRIILLKTIPTLFGNLGRVHDNIDVPKSYAELVVRSGYARYEPEAPVLVERPAGMGPPPIGFPSEPEQPEAVRVWPSSDVRKHKAKPEPETHD
jgi:hypothetical protein